MKPQSNAKVTLKKKSDLAHFNFDLLSFHRVRLCCVWFVMIGRSGCVARAAYKIDLRV
jgi:hypothetical protein